MTNAGKCKKNPVEFFDKFPACQVVLSNLLSSSIDVHQGFFPRNHGIFQGLHRKKFSFFCHFRGKILRTSVFIERGIFHKQKFYRASCSGRNPRNDFPGTAKLHTPDLKERSMDRANGGNFERSCGMSLGRRRCCCLAASYMLLQCGRQRYFRCACVFSCSLKKRLTKIQKFARNH